MALKRPRQQKESPALEMRDVEQGTRDEKVEQKPALTPSEGAKEGVAEEAAMPEKIASEGSVKLVAVFRPIRNPYTGTWFEPGIAVPVDIDNWTECQIEAGILKKV